ncbi:hypothetical protein [Plantibacter sp. MCCC 1A11337]|uniref:MmyB family transcriptional regulator n=1 Tax=Plantibacter sp. MCCC 1A11337 TaxID=2736644 RepID=UPI001C2DF19F
MSDLVGELSNRSERFHALWAAHNVRFHRTEAKRPVTPSSATSNSATTRSSSQQTYTAEPGIPSADALRILASWAATTSPGPRPGVPSPEAGRIIDGQDRGS